MNDDLTRSTPNENPFAPPPLLAGDQAKGLGIDAGNGRVVPYASAQLGAKLVFVAIGLNVLISLTILSMLLKQRSLLSASPIYTDSQPSPAVFARMIGELNQIDQVINALEVLQLVCLVGGAIVFLSWLHRVTRNLPALGATRLDITPGWAVGSWFIPILNLFRPYQAVQQAWKASDPSQDYSVKPTNWRDRAGSGLVLGWWLFWIGGGVYGRIVSSSLAPVDYRGVITQIDSLVALKAVVVVSGVLAIAMVYQLTKRQTQLNAQVEAAHRYTSLT